MIVVRCKIWSFGDIVLGKQIILSDKNINEASGDYTVERKLQKRKVNSETGRYIQGTEALYFKGFGIQCFFISERGKETHEHYYLR